MKPQNKLRREIMLYAATDANYLPYKDVSNYTTDIDVENTWMHFIEEHHSYGPQDVINDFRYQGEDSNCNSKEWSRHYDHKERAVQCCDGSWVGYTFWSGGGKHGTPEEIDYISDAYDIVVEKEYKIIKREFKRVDEK